MAFEHLVRRQKFVSVVHKADHRLLFSFSLTIKIFLLRSTLDKISPCILTIIEC
jgi:hypothetical protein